MIYMNEKEKYAIEYAIRQLQVDKKRLELETTEITNSMIKATQHQKNIDILKNFLTKK